MNINMKKALVSLALAASLGLQPFATFPVNVFAEEGGNNIDAAGEVVDSLKIQDVGPVFKGEASEKTVDPPKVVVNGKENHDYPIKWEIVSKNESGIVTIDETSGKLTVDFDKMDCTWIKVVEVKVSVGSKSDSYKLAIVNAKDIDSVDINQVLGDARQDAYETHDFLLNFDDAYITPCFAAGSAYFCTNEVYCFGAEIANKAPLNCAVDSAKDLVYRTATGAIKAAKEKFGFGAKFNVKLDNDVKLNRAAAKAAAEFAQAEANKDPGNADKAKDARFVMAAANACEAGSAVFWTLKNNGLTNKTNAQIAYAAYVTCEYVWTFFKQNDVADVARLKANYLQPLCYTTDELNEIASSENISNFSIY